MTCVIGFSELQVTRAGQPLRSPKKRRALGPRTVDRACSMEKKDTFCIVKAIGKAFTKLSFDGHSSQQGRSLQDDRHAAPS